MLINVEHFQIFTQILEELKNVKLEMQTLTSEIETLKLELTSLRQDARALQSSDRVYQQDKDWDETAQTVQAKLTEAEIAQPPAVIDWLATRNVTVKNYRQSDPADTVFDELAHFLGSRYESLAFLYETMKKRLVNGSFSLSLAKRSQKEISDATTFCGELQKYAFLQKYQYNRNSKTIYADIQNNGNVINFLTGDWFERFVYLQTCALLEEEEVAYSSLVNARVALPNEDDFELDILFLVNEQVIWIECKTGNIEERINKYSGIRKMFGIPPQKAIVVNLGMSDDRAVGLSSLYDITVTNHVQFLNHLRMTLGLANGVQTDYTYPAVYVPVSNLASLLNKANLRPLLQYRRRIIAELIDMVGALNEPITLRELKEVLVTRIADTELSKTQVQDILNAIAKGGCLLDDQGNTVTSLTKPFLTLISDNLEEIEERCNYSYVRAILLKDRHFFANQQNWDEYEQVTGLKPAPEIIHQVSAELSE
jgi:hypothetical protein